MARWDRLRARTPAGILDEVELRDWAASRLVGTPDEVVAQLRDWEALGVEQVICSFAGLPFSVFEDEQLELAAELVLPRLKGPRRLVRVRREDRTGLPADLRTGWPGT